jgi:hypothetical protein
VGGGLLAISAAVVLSVASGPAQGQQTRPTIVVYKSPACGCCQNWVEHMTAAGFDTRVQNVEKIGEVKGTYGISEKLAACHTALVDGYVVEGHVPADVVKQLLAERPKVAGIAVPGMPIGSPGMEQPGSRPQPYDVLAFDRDGTTHVYASRR